MLSQAVSSLSRTCRKWATSCWTNGWHVTERKVRKLSILTATDRSLGGTGFYRTPRPSEITPNSAIDMRKLLDSLYDIAGWLAALFMVGTLCMVLAGILGR